MFLCLISAVGNDLRGNVVTGNLNGSVASPGSTGSTIIGNYAHGNGGFDLNDTNPTATATCGGATTANQSCIH